MSRSKPGNNKNLNEMNVVLVALYKYQNFNVKDNVWNSWTD